MLKYKRARGVDGLDREKFLVKTFGCQMNKHDSERIAGMLVQEGYEPARRVEEADIIIFNTCCVRKHAEDRLYGQVGALKSLKRKKPNLIIAVGGCLAQKDGREIQERATHVDLVFGTHNLSSLPNLIRQVRENSAKICEIWKEPKILPTKLPSLREHRYFTWVTITIGCNNFCSYCIVPYVRGREISRPMQDIHSEVRKLAQEGVIEITLLGQNVNSYGRDLYGKGQFSTLLRELDKIPGIKRIRFTTSHPRDLSDEIIKAVAECDKVCEHFHLPVQAGSDRILKLMNRGYTKDRYLEMVRKIRETIPECSITTDIMVGFPGETEEDFQETLDLVEKARFDQAFTFIYSPRPGTPAAEIEVQIPQEVKLERFKKLVLLQSQICLEQNRKLMGKTLEIFVEGPSKKEKNILTGRTRTNKVVNFQGPRELINKMVDVVIVEAHTWYLMGTLTDANA
ncbi:MAG: tRNA (N6-isopentenyl adenosine(37)-C2)-methylthiotransferase MiaB [Actinomycetota bacterium]